VFGPAVNESKSQIPPNVKLALEDLIDATYKPIFIMAVFWHCSTCTKKPINV
jgi:hypothetical protein